MARSYSLLEVSEDGQRLEFKQPRSTSLCRLASCAAAVLLLVLLLLLWALLPGIFTCSGAAAVCSLSWKQNCAAGFSKCVARLPLGANDVPMGYLVLSRYSLPSHINLTGIPISSTFDYDGIIMEGLQMPEKLYSGEWWRGNELGGLVNNPYYWSGIGIWPMSMATGITERQHTAVRRVLEKAFAVPRDIGWIRPGLRQFFKERAAAGELRVPEDISIWVHQALMNSTFQRPVDFERAKRFVHVQHDLLTYGTMSQLVPKGMYHSLGGFFKMPETRDAIAAYARSYLEDVQEKWGAELNQDCLPSENCALQASSAILDGLMSMGGRYLPYGIRTGLAILFSQSSSNPTLNRSLSGSKLEFFWECLRFAPPVLGIPYWKGRPLCAKTTAEETQRLNWPQGQSAPCPMFEPEGQTGYPPVNQWTGGQRYVLGILLGQLDPRIWGEGADRDFRIRTATEYDRYSVGFAEFAANGKVNAGRSNRDCPAKDLALLLGQIFFEEFDVKAWEAVDPNIRLDPQGAAENLAGFTLRPF